MTRLSDHEATAHATMLVCLVHLLTVVDVHRNKLRFQSVSGLPGSTQRLPSPRKPVGSLISGSQKLQGGNGTSTSAMKPGKTCELNIIYVWFQLKLGSTMSQVEDQRARITRRDDIFSPQINNAQIISAKDTNGLFPLPRESIISQLFSVKRLLTKFALSCKTTQDTLRAPWRLVVS